FACRLLCGERRAFARTAETACTRRRLRDQIAVRIRYRDQRVVERSRNVNDAVRNITLLFLLKSFFLSCFCHNQYSAFRCRPSVKSRRRTGNRKLITGSYSYFLPGAFFLATAALRGPFLVLAFVCVRCPRTGRLLR